MGEGIHVIKEFIWAANIYHPGEADLWNNGTELTACRGDTVRRGPISGGESLTRYNEGSRVGTKVLEEVGEAV
jgi:hypothetical protein